MAAEESWGVRFEGTLSVAVEDAINPDCPPNFFADSQMAGRARFGTTGCYRESRLWLGSPKMCFRGLITAGGDDSVRQWRAGFLQSISEAYWNGHYSDGKVLQYRLNTNSGPLKDGLDYCLFMKPEWSLNPTETPSVHRVEVFGDDGPANMYFREYSGDPSRPNHQPEGAALGQLMRTEGKYRFQTYLAVVNEYRKSIVTLGECHWTLVWDGAYDFAARNWTPVNVEQVLTLQEWDRAAKYESLTAASPTPPFSLFMEKAKKNWEVLTEDGWIPCKDCYPNHEEAD